MNLGEVPVEKLDFSIPGSPGYGDHPEFEIFNPAGGQSTYVTDPRSLEYWKTYMDEFQIIFSLENKIPGLGSGKSELLAIAPKIKKYSCELINKNSGNQIIPELKKIGLTPHPQELPDTELVILPEGQKDGCVKTLDGYYYYQILVER